MQHLMRWMAAVGLMFAAAADGDAAELRPPRLAGLSGLILGTDMAGLVPHIVGIYEDAGLSWYHGIAWQIGPFTTSFWYYDPSGYEIIAGEMPVAGETAAYWQNWSAVLTDGAWRPEAFFHDSIEAAELARFNQFVLATHESAHAITFRYDSGHLERHGYDINCREYYADRLTAGILAEAARQDPRIAGWRTRYHALVADMAEAVPAPYRVHIPSVAALDDDCAIPSLVQPTPDHMEPYASAYFERWRALLEADLPPLTELFQTHLVDRYAVETAAYPYASEASRYRIGTDAPPASIDLDVAAPGLPTGQVRSHVAAFGREGAIYEATLFYDSATREPRLTFGKHTEAADVVPLGDFAVWPRPAAQLLLGSMAVLGPGRFAVALDQWWWATDDDTAYQVSWLMLTRAGNGWTVALLREAPGAGQGGVMLSGSGRLYLLETPVPIPGTFNDAWVVREIDPVSFVERRSTRIAAPVRRPIAIDDEMRVYLAAGRLLWRTAPDGDEAILAGTGQPGTRDGPARDCDLVEVRLMQWLGTDALLLDRVSAGSVVRRLRPLPG